VVTRAEQALGADSPLTVALFVVAWASRSSAALDCFTAKPKLKTMLTAKSFLTVILISLMIISCARRQTRVVIKQGAAQEFIVSGQGLLDDFVVSGPDYQRGLPYSKVYWEIAPQQDFDVIRFRELGPIIYGKVPLGFRQVTPEKGEPPAISEGWPNSVQLAIRNGGGVNMLFSVHNGKIVTEADAD
jgi:hypothetical protein